MAYVKNYLNNICKFSILFSEDSSILISSTRDKIIVNNHDHYFHKYAFGMSLVNAKNELCIYRQLPKKTNFFCISKIFDIYDDENLCSFKMEVPYVNKRQSIEIDNLVDPLIEFFSYKNSIKINISKHIQDIISEFKKITKYVEIDFDMISHKIKKAQILLGLIHGDFKPWNITYGEPLLFYDFEEARQNGLPLEDIFNFIIDSDIIYVSPKKLHKKIFQQTNVASFNRYLDLLKINIDFRYLLYLHLMQKVIFCYKANKPTISNQYFNLLVHIYRREMF